MVQVAQVAQAVQVVHVVQAVQAVQECKTSRFPPPSCTLEQDWQDCAVISCPPPSERSKLAYNLASLFKKFQESCRPRLAKLTALSWSDIGPLFPTHCTTTTTTAATATTTPTSRAPPPTNHLVPQPIVIVIINENDCCRRCRGSGPLFVTAAEVADAHLP